MAALHCGETSHRGNPANLVSPSRVQQELPWRRIALSRGHSQGDGSGLGIGN